MKRARIVGIVIGVASIAAQIPVHGQSCSDQFCQFYHGDYAVQNDKWGMKADPSGSQQVASDGKGWHATVNWSMTNGTVKSYPSIVSGWNFGANWTPNRGGFPVLVSANAPLPTRTKWSTTGTFTHYDVAYDLFLSPESNPQKPSGEVMVWLGQEGQRPAGKQVASGVKIAGVDGTWNVWIGNVGWQVYSFERTTNTNTFSGNLRPFVNYLAFSHSYLSKSWYVLDMQFGVEILEGKGTFRNLAYYGQAYGKDVTAKAH